MKKSKEILTIVSILILVVGVGIFIGLRGIKAHNNHYIRIEVNPKIEFITDSHNTVLSYVPINEEAKIIVCQENFNGLNIPSIPLFKSVGFVLSVRSADKLIKFITLTNTFVAEINASSWTLISYSAIIGVISIIVCI